MKLHYKQAMNSLTLSPEAAERIQSKLRRPAKTARLRPAAILVAAAILVLGTTAAASGVFYHDIPAAIAQSLEPIQLSDTDQGINMTVQSATVEDGVLTAYITMEDLEEDRLRDGADLYDSYRINTPYRADVVLKGWSPLGFDEESGTYGHLITIQSRDNSGAKLNFKGKNFTFSVRQLLLGQKKEQSVTLSPDWSSIPVISPDATYYILGGSGDAFKSYSGWASGGEALVLQPGSWEVPVIEGVSISAAGSICGQFHLQLRYDNLGPDDHGWINLITPEGNEIPRLLTLSFRDDDGPKYSEYVYDISPEELTGCTLTGEFTTGGYLLDGNWKVTFTLSCEE